MKCIDCNSPISAFASRCGGCDYRSERTRQTASADAIYARLVSEAGLYGPAFFGWKATPQQRAALRALWRQSRRRAERLAHA